MYPCVFLVRKDDFFVFKIMNVRGAIWALIFTHRNSHAVISTKVPISAWCAGNNNLFCVVVCQSHSRWAFWSWKVCTSTTTLDCQTSCSSTPVMSARQWVDIGGYARV